MPLRQRNACTCDRAKPVTLHDGRVIVPWKVWHRDCPVCPPPGSTISESFANALLYAGTRR